MGSLDLRWGLGLGLRSGKVMCGGYWKKRGFKQTQVGILALLISFLALGKLSLGQTSPNFSFWDGEMHVLILSQLSLRQGQKELEFKER